MLILYLFIPAAAVVFFLMAVVSIPKEAITAGRAIIADHIFLYRTGVITVLATGYFASEIFKLTISGWLILCAPGALVFALHRKAFDSAAQLRFVFAFKAALYVWRGLR